MRHTSFYLVQAAVALLILSGPLAADDTSSAQRGFTIPLVDLANEHECQVIVDREPGQYLGHPTTVLLEDGRTMIAVLLRENARRRNSFVIFSDDEGATWTEPRELPGALTGDRHTGKYALDGRLFISFRDRSPKGTTSPTEGDWVGWVGTYDDIARGF